MTPLHFGNFRVRVTVGKMQNKSLTLLRWNILQNGLYFPQPFYTFIGLFQRLRRQFKKQAVVKGPPVDMFPALISLAFFLAAAILLNLVNVHRHFDLQQIMIDISNCNDIHRPALHHATRKKATISFGVCSA